MATFQDILNSANQLYANGVNHPEVSGETKSLIKRVVSPIMKLRAQSKTKPIFAQEINAGVYQALQPMDQLKLSLEADLVYSPEDPVNEKNIGTAVSIDDLTSMANVYENNLLNFNIQSVPEYGIYTGTQQKPKPMDMARKRKEVDYYPDRKVPTRERLESEMLAGDKFPTEEDITAPPPPLSDEEIEEIEKRNSRRFKMQKTAKKISLLHFVKHHGPYSPEKNEKILKMCKKHKLTGHLEKLQKLCDRYMADRAGGKDFNDSMLAKAMKACEKACMKEEQKAQKAKKATLRMDYLIKSASSHTTRRGRRGLSKTAKINIMKKIARQFKEILRRIAQSEPFLPAEQTRSMQLHQENLVKQQPMQNLSPELLLFIQNTPPEEFAKLHESLEGLEVKDTTDEEVNEIFQNIIEDDEYQDYEG